MHEEVGKLQRAVDEAEQDLAAGKWIEHSEVEAKLRHWSTEKL
jgi:hypothetical protein